MNNVEDYQSLHDRNNVERRHQEVLKEMRRSRWSNVIAVALGAILGAVAGGIVSYFMMLAQNIP